MLKPSLVRRRVLAFVEARGTATVCPSEIARDLDPESWRDLMQPVRDAAAALQRRGLIDAYQRGRPVDVVTVRGPIRLRSRRAAVVDHRAHPELYRIGRGEEGVLTVEPYKSELLPLWRFATPALAQTSAAALWRRFVAYGRQGDFVGMDMARKYLQMGWTRARRYANHPSGRKYRRGTRAESPRTEDAEKARAAAIFKEAYDRARVDPTYVRLREAHTARLRAAAAGVTVQG